MAPGAVFYVSTGREKKMANFSCEDTARLGNAKDKDEPGALRGAWTHSRSGARAGTDASGLDGPRSPRRDRVASPKTQP